MDPGHLAPEDSLNKYMKFWKIDIYYIEKIVEPIVSSIIHNELVNNNGKVTYKGLFYNELT